MLSNLIGNSKFVLFRDHVSMERTSHQTILDILKDKNENDLWTNVLPEDDSSLFSKDKPPLPTLNLPTDKRTVILPPASLLFQRYSASSVFRGIQTLTRSPNVKSLFLWLTVDNFPEYHHLPELLQHMADVVVRLQNKTELELLIRKSTGSVSRKQYRYEIKDGHFNVSEIKKVKKKEVPEEKEIVRPETLGTFKIELSEKDKIARNNLVLPFEKHLKIEEKDSPVAPQTGGKIIYDLDRGDDFDEEDPDDDLDI